jgi:UDP-2-acetamido-2-deoxy-ribo-hexuluronate aminotransferase
MITSMPFAERITTHKERYARAFKESMNNPSFWLQSSKAHNELTSRCHDFTAIPYWHFTDSGTDALSVAVAMKTEPGDEVIVPGFGWIATPASVGWIGRKPVFCDVGMDALIDPEALSNTIARHPKAKVLIPVHLYGKIQDIDALTKACNEADDLWIVEDCAQSFPIDVEESEYVQGTSSDVACFSFDIGKQPAVNGTGGAVATFIPQTIDKLKSLAQLGMKPQRDGFEGWGTKSHMDDSSAMIALEDLDILDETNDRKKRMDNVKWLDENLPKRTLIGRNHCGAFYPIWCKKMNNVEAIKHFADNDVTASKFMSFTKFPWMEATTPVPNSNLMASQLIHIPTHSYLSQDDLEHMAELAQLI